MTEPITPPKPWRVRMTPAKRRVLVAIARYTSAHGYPPTNRELGRLLGTVSTYGVAWHIDRLEYLGCVRREARLSRGLTLTDKGRAEAGLVSRERETDPGSVDEGET